MEQRPEEDTIGSLEQAQEALYRSVDIPRPRAPLQTAAAHSLPHAWQDEPLPRPTKKHVRIAALFFGASLLFFLIALAVAAYFFLYGGNSVSPDNITIDVQGPTSINGGDTVPLALTIINKNPVAIENATIEVDFPDGTRSADGTLTSYPHYIENVGTIASGATITRAVKAIVFGGAGQTLTVPVQLSYSTASSNAVFTKKSSYALSVTSTPLAVSVDTLSETVSGAPVTFDISIRSNATSPLDNVVLTMSSPFGFTMTSSSIPVTNGSFLIGTLAPGASQHVSVTGTLVGQDNEQRSFHFSVGTAKSSQDQTLGLTYMSQDATISIAAPFISTVIALNGNAGDTIVVSPGSPQSAVLTYTNTLPIAVTDASISVAIGGSAIDYNSIRTSSGFYNSSNHTIVFSKDMDPALAQLSPGATGMDTFTFSTLRGVASPTVTLNITAAGTRVGQSNVPEQVTSSAEKTIKVSSSVQLAAASSRTQGGFAFTGPVPPQVGRVTTYAVVWTVKNQGSALAGGTVTATLPSYVTYTGTTSGNGTFSYNSVSNTLTWTTGDIGQNSSVQGAFEVSLTPSTSQKGAVPALTSAAAFSGYDRFAGVPVSATAEPVTTETTIDSTYVRSTGTVQ